MIKKYVLSYFLIFVITFGTEMAYSQVKEEKKESLNYIKSVKHEYPNLISQAPSSGLTGFNLFKSNMIVEYDTFPRVDTTFFGLDTTLVPIDSMFYFYERRIIKGKVRFCRDSTRISKNVIGGTTPIFRLDTVEIAIKPRLIERMDKNFNGIEDRREGQLQQLAEMFSPILFKNTKYSVPLDVNTVLNHGRMPLLEVESWDMTRANKTFIGKNTITIDSEKYNGERPLAQNDSLLKDLVNEFTKGWFEKYRHITPAKADTFKYLYFDTEGVSGDRKNYYSYFTDESLLTKFEPQIKIYAHPFISSVNEGYEFIIQYWFFYPFNDWINKHEGDWEHINVIITKESLKDSVMSEEDIEDILSDSENILDQLVLKRVEYYFHHNMMTLDYMNKYVLDTREKDLDYKSWRMQNPNISGKEKKDLWMWERIKNRLNDPAIGNHPVVYIGGDSKAYAELFSLPNKSGFKDSHGSYPFPGTYYSVGPLATSEKINGNLNSEGKDIQTSEPNVVTFGSANNTIELLPDWESIINLLGECERYRKKWFWMVLPIHWGYPASPSFLSSLLQGVDVGNLSPVGPTFNTAWNRVGDASGYENYDPHVLGRLTMLTPKDHFKNGWGVWNILNVVHFIPPFDSFNKLYDLIRDDPKNKQRFYPEKVTLPNRNFSFTVLPSYKLGLSRFINAWLDGKREFKVDGEDETENNANGLSGALNYYVGNSFSSELQFTHIAEEPNFISNVKSKVGSYSFLEITSSVRYDFLNDLIGIVNKNTNLDTDPVKPFIKFGAGYAYYNFQGREKQINEVNDLPSTKIVRKKFKEWAGFTPNVWSYGLGIDFLSQKKPSVAIWPKLGFRIEYMRERRLFKSRTKSNKYFTNNNISFGMTLNY